MSAFCKSAAGGRMKDGDSAVCFFCKVRISLKYVKKDREIILKSKYNGNHRRLVRSLRGDGPELK